jgi:hypothetical protein
MALGGSIVRRGAALVGVPFDDSPRGVTIRRTQSEIEKGILADNDSYRWGRRRD